jgi:hypothetical protein
MIGKVTKFYGSIGVGIIAAEDGRKFRFHSRDLTSRAGQASGVEVDFEVRSGRPRDIIPLTGSPWNAFARSTRR